MLKIIFIIFVILLLFVLGLSFYGRRFRSPYLLNFYFGPKGVGKSTYFCKLMLDDIKHGWTVYTDIPDINIDGVRKFNAKDLENFSPPNKSSIYIDEGGIRLNKRNWKTFTDGEREYYKLQRHFRNKVTINSQSWDIDLTCRELCDNMYLCNNLFGVILLLRPINRKIVLTDPTGDAESRIADQLKFAPFWNWKFCWLPKYHKHFNSFSIPPREEMPYTPVKSLKKEIKRLRNPKQ